MFLTTENMFLATENMVLTTKNLYEQPVGTESRPVTTNDRSENYTDPRDVRRTCGSLQFSILNLLNIAGLAPSFEQTVGSHLLPSIEIEIVQRMVYT